MKINIGVIADMQAGSVVGIWPEGFPTTMADPYILNQGQQYLLDNWRRIAKEIPPLDILLINGDSIEGQQPKEEGRFLCEVEPENQADAAVLLLSDYKRRIRKGGEVYYTEGTEYHEGRAAKHARHIAQELGAVPMDSTHPCWDWLLLEVAGKKLDMAHRQTITIIRRTVPAERELDFSEMHKNPADLVIRSHSHYHLWLELAREDRLQYYLSTPGWQLQTHFVRTSISPNRKDGSLLGMVVVTIQDGEITHKAKVFPHPEQRRAEYAKSTVHNG